MLYTLSKANYDEETLNFFFSHLSENDAVVLWQDGVLQAVKVRNFCKIAPLLFIGTRCASSRIAREAHCISVHFIIRISQINSGLFSPGCTVT